MLLGVVLVASVGAFALHSMGGQMSLVGQQIYKRAETLSALERSIKDRNIALKDLASRDDLAELGVQLPGVRFVDEAATATDKDQGVSMAVWAGK